MKLQLIALGLLLSMTAAHSAEPKPTIGAADATALKVDEAPAIDGQLTDKAWSLAARNLSSVLSGWRVYQKDGAGPFVAQQRIGYVCYDDENLYVASQAFTPDVYKLKPGLNGVPFTGDCLEVMIKAPDGKIYQWGMDIEGNIAFGQGSGTATAADVKGEADFGDNFWGAEMAIPWKVLGITPKSGLKIGFNLAANKAYQGNDLWQSIHWGKRCGVNNYETVLELK